MFVAEGIGNEATALLMAAALELLAACRAALASNVEHHGLPCTCEACCGLRAAIARAEVPR